MIRNIVMTCLLGAILVGAGAAAEPAAAGTQAAPAYAQLSGYEFGKQDVNIASIVKEVETATAANRAEIEARLLKAAQQPGATYACKSFVADMLRVVGSKASLNVVLEWLTDAKTANLATLALQGIKDPEINRPLARVMRSAQGSVKIQLIQALAARRMNGIVKDLAGLSQGQDAALARVAIEALGNIGTAEAAADLKAIKTTETLAVAREQAMIACAAQLQKDGKKDAAREIWKSLFETGSQAWVVAAALNGQVETDGAAALPAVLGALKDKRTMVAVRAASAAQGLPAEAAVTHGLCDALPGLAAPVQTALLRTLGVRKDKGAYPAVKTAMGAQDKAVQCEAVRACETLADATAVEPLMKLAAGNDDAAAAAKLVLARMNEPGLDGILMHQLDAAQAETVSVAAGVLVARGYRAATPRLMELAQNGNGGIRGAALTALKSFTGTNDVPALMTLLAKAAPGDRGKIAQILWTANQGVNPKDKRFMTLWQAAPADNTVVRTTLLTLAGQAGGAEPLKIVKGYLGDADAKTKDAAIRALCAWPDETAAADTLEVLKTTDNLAYRVLAAEALRTRLTDTKTRLPMARRQEILREALAKLERPEDKQIIQWALDKLAQPRTRGGSR